MSAEQSGRLDGFGSGRPVVEVGSRIRFSVALIQDFSLHAGHTSLLCEVERLIREADGTTTIWVKRADDDTVPTSHPDGHRG